MKYFNLILLLFACSCGIKNNVTGKYILDKSKNNSYNIVLTIQEDMKYTIKTLSTGVGGTTNGYWVLEKRELILYPESPRYSEERIGDSIYKIEEYKPFSDTLTFKIKNKRLLNVNSKINLVLHKVN